MKFLSLEVKKGKPNLPLKVELAVKLGHSTYCTPCRTKLAPELATDSQAPPSRASKESERLFTWYHKIPHVTKKLNALLADPNSAYDLQGFMEKLSKTRVVLPDKCAINLNLNFADVVRHV